MSTTPAPSLPADTSPGPAPATLLPVDGGAHVRAAGVRSTRGARALLDGLDLTVFGRSRLAVVGESGRGATPLPHLLAGLLGAHHALLLDEPDDHLAGPLVDEVTAALRTTEAAVAVVADDRADRPDRHLEPAPWSPARTTDRTAPRPPTPPTSAPSTPGSPR